MFAGFMTVAPGVVRVAIKVQPRATRDEVLGVHGAEVRVRLRAPPVDAAANEALVAFFAAQLHCARSQVRLVRGQRSRHKLIEIRGVEPDQILSGLGLPTGS